MHAPSDCTLGAHSIGISHPACRGACENGNDWCCMHLTTIWSRTIWKRGTTERTRAPGEHALKFVQLHVHCTLLHSSCKVIAAKLVWGYSLAPASSCKAISCQWGYSLAPASSGRVRHTNSNENSSVICCECRQVFTRAFTCILDIQWVEFRRKWRPAAPTTAETNVRQPSRQWLMHCFQK